MTKKELSQIKNLNKEIILLKKQIENIETLINPEITTDIVKGSFPQFPYIEHTIKITGIDYNGYDKKVKRLRRQLQNRLNELMDKVAEANEYIAAIEDAEIRMILQCRYIIGLTWDEIEKELYMSKRTAQIKLKKWWEGNK